MFVRARKGLGIRCCKNVAASEMETVLCCLCYIDCNVRNVLSRTKDDAGPCRLMI